MPMLWVAILLGVVEGLTEFLPISSTGHLIIVGNAVGFVGKRAEAYEIFIQLGAILAVAWEYRSRLTKLVTDLPKKREAQKFAVALAVAFLPAAVVGLAIHDFISEHLFSPLTVALALIAGAILILVVESRPQKIVTERAEATGIKQAFAVGLAQCLALWPGFSRSAATILGGLTVGMSRPAATEFSFFLAIPVMFAATFYDLFKNREALSGDDVLWLGIAFVLSFLVAWASIRWLLRYVSRHSFKPFAWYRLALGAIILTLSLVGWL